MLFDNVKGLGLGIPSTTFLQHKLNFYHNNVSFQKDMTKGKQLLLTPLTSALLTRRHSCLLMCMDHRSSNSNSYVEV